MSFRQVETEKKKKEVKSKGDYNVFSNDDNRAP